MEGGDDLPARQVAGGSEDDDLYLGVSSSLTLFASSSSMSFLVFVFSAALRRLFTSMAAELLAHGGEHLVCIALVLPARETHLQRQALSRGRDGLVYGFCRGPSALPGVLHPPSISLGPRVLQGHRRQVEEPRPDDAPVTPDLPRSCGGRGRNLRPSRALSRTLQRRPPSCRTLSRLHHLHEVPRAAGSTHPQPLSFPGASVSKIGRSRSTAFSSPPTIRL